MSEVKKKTKMKGCQENPRHIFPDNFVTSIASFRETDTDNPEYKISCFNEDDNFYKQYEISLTSKMLCKYDCKKCNRSFMLSSIELVEGKWCICCAYVKGQEQKLKGACGCTEEHKGECKRKEETKVVIVEDNKEEQIENYPIKTKEELKEEKFHKYPQTFENSFASFEDPKDPKGPKYKVSCYRIDNKYKAEEIRKGSSNICGFDCSCGHTFYMRISHITNLKRLSWCPYCGGSQLCNNPLCQMCKNNSIMSNEMFKFWDESNEENPQLLFISERNKKGKFKCLDGVCHHISELCIDYVMKGNKPRCSYCNNRILCKEEKNCEICLDKSFSRKFPEQAKSWDNEVNELKATEAFNGDDSEFGFKCIVCNHRFRKHLSKIKSTNRWCEYCSGRTLCGDINCIDCFNKSFAKSPKAKYWHGDNDKQPHMVHLHSGYYKAKFTCEKNHEFKATLGHVSDKKNPTWCPLCVHKTETMVYEFLREVYEYNVEFQAKFIWCKSQKNSNYYLEFDILLKSKNIIIEIDGPHHFNDSYRGKNHKEQVASDCYKMQRAMDNGFSIIRIEQNDVYINRINWKERIIKAINNIIEINEPCVVYIAHKDHFNIYINHRHEMEIYYIPLPHDDEFNDDEDEEIYEV